jgi:hypothetical protein
VCLCFFVLSTRNVILFPFARVTCVIKMASTQEKAFCVIQCAKTNSVTSVQQEFCEHYCKDPAQWKSIYIWYKQFETKRSVYKGNDKHKQYNLCCELQVKFKDDVAAWHTILSDEAILHLSGKVSHHSIRFWDHKSHQAWTGLHNSQCVLCYFTTEVPFPPSMECLLHFELPFISTCHISGNI